MGQLQASIGPDPSKWTFGNMTRGPDGKFSDADMAGILIKA